MSTIAIVAQGTLLKIGDGASPEQFTTVPEMKRLSGGGISFDLLDATSHDSGTFREWVPSLADGENVSGSMNWRPGNTVHISVRTKSYARTLTNFKLVFPDTPSNTCAVATYIRTITGKADIGTLLEADITLKVTGQPTWS